MNSPESLSSVSLANWPDRSFEQLTQVPKVLEWKTLPSNNGNEPSKTPYRWLCGRDKNGEPTNPEELAAKPIQYIPTIKDRVNRDNLKASEWQGALEGHPVLNDAHLWAIPTLEVDLSEAAIQNNIRTYRQAAIAEAESSDQVATISAAEADRI